jgi:hypothetical protein
MGSALQAEKIGIKLSIILFQNTKNSGLSSGTSASFSSYSAGAQK